ncbi:MAG TPA: hypothetical protein VLW26_07715 [Steroidobacteraceae bacterium]|nr:hypothetical protein [Steroidobacteraceae bacterium]
MSELERQLTEALRTLPPLRAPSSLAPRIWREIERRAALPWWRRSVAHWPFAARVGFVVLAVGAAALTFVASPLHVQPVVMSVSPDLQRGAHSLLTLSALVRLAFAALPQGLLSTFLVAGVALYVALFGLAAAGYRMLFGSAHSAKVA